MIFRAELGRYKDSEIVLAEKVVCGLRKGMLCLADRLFPGLALWKKPPPPERMCFGVRRSA
ncbi:MAG: hypothetical protein IAE94_16220 [Chthoniobacterales bacterium]|nr:hypothetical protein [Chthoniobacterales bacterium]